MRKTGPSSPCAADLRSGKEYGKRRLRAIKDSSSDGIT